MSVEAWTTLGVVTLTLVALVRHWAAPGIAVPGATLALLTLGVITPAEALSGFVNPAPVTVAALYVLARAVQETGAVRPLVRWACSDPAAGARPSAPPSTLRRIVWSSAGASTLLNNTPIVAMLIPELDRRSPAAGPGPSATAGPSPWLMPLSFAAILGGTLTLIGTSTNIVVSGLLEGAGHAPLGMFEMTPVALPMALAGIAIVLRRAPRVFPAREEGTPGVRTAPASPPPPTRTAPGAPFVLGVTALMVILSTLGVLPIVKGALLAALIMVGARVLTPREALGAVDLNVILLIGGAFGVGEAIRVSGLADVAAGGLVAAAAAFGPVASLAAVVVCTILLTELITNNAAAVLMFPIAVAAALSIDAEPRPFAWAVALAASASFLSPVGYQTNTMVLAPGRYRFMDYARFGLPVTLVVAVLIVLGVAIRWGLL